MHKKVLMAFDDPGGGLAVSSLIESLQKEEIDIEIYTGKLSEKFLEKENRSYNKIESMISREESEKIIGKVNPDLLITGTGGGNAEQELRNRAFEKNIKSIVILDFWKDYGRRWLYASYSLSEMKDKVCVMDSLTRDEMVSENFLTENIKITGHPYLDKIFNSFEYVFQQNIIKANQILFLSQPLNIIGLTDYKIHPLKNLLESLTKAASERNVVYSLIIKLHPSESMSSEIDHLISQYNSESVNIKLSDKLLSAEELISESELIAGYNTIAMFESRAMNKRTISLKVAPMKDSLLKAMQAAGIEICEPDQISIYESIIKKPDEFKNESKFKGGIENCINVILSELNLNHN
ncbi:MAG TPA: hypothetical protein PKC91_01045 [Ignavibacteria bacterium]|nr:hypothetical protein [Ignavibacteria bacterium]